VRGSRPAQSGLAKRVSAGDTKSRLVTEMPETYFEYL
jgi:hypothetical protein